MVRRLSRPDTLLAHVQGNWAAQRGSKSSFPIALICTTRRRIPAISSTDQGPEKDDLTGQLGRLCNALDVLFQPKSSFPIALICTTRRRIPAISSTDQGPEKDDLTGQLGGLCQRPRRPLPAFPTPHDWVQTLNPQLSTLNPQPLTPKP